MNPKLKTVALDFGNYELKTFDGGEKPRAIRSIHRKLPRGVNALIAKRNSPIVEIDKERYHIGFQAAKYSSHEQTARLDKAQLAKLHLYSCLEVTEGSFKLIVSHHSPEIVTAALRKALIGKHSYTRNGQNCNILIKSVEVVPEGIGAYWAARNAGFVPTSGHTIVIDIGGGSWLYRVIDSDGDIIAQDVSDRLGSYALASQIAHDDRLKQPLRRYGLTSADPGKVLEGFCQSHRYEETGISWADWLDEYREPWFSNIFSQVRADLASYLPSTRRFIVCGGGAHLVAHKFSGNSAFVVMPQPNFSNVVGMYEQFVGDHQLAVAA